MTEYNNLENNYFSGKDSETTKVSWNDPEKEIPPYQEQKEQVASSNTQPMPQNNPVRVRRVGIFTMGIALILGGIAALLYLFVPDFGIVSLLKYSPLLLILLGVEILISGIVFRGDRIKYDFLSMLVCFFLICICVGASAVFPFLRYYGPHLRDTETALSEEASERYYQILSKTGDVQGVWVDVSLDALDPEEQLTIDSLRPGDNLHLSIRLFGEYPDKQTFCQKVEEVMKAVCSEKFHPDTVDIYNRDNQYSVYFSTPFEMNFTAEQISEIAQEEVTESLEEESSVISSEASQEDITESLENSSFALEE